MHNLRKDVVNLLNLGCGSHYHSAWTNINFASASREVISHDLLQGIPFPAHTFDAVYLSHLLEHFPHDKADFLISECFRVLKEKGIIRIVVPDLEKIMQNYFIYLRQALDGNQAGARRYRWTMMELFDQMVREKPGGAMKKFLDMADKEDREFIRAKIGREAENYWKAAAPETPKNIFRWLRDKSLGEIGHFITHHAIRTILRLLAGEEARRAYDIGHFRRSGEIHYWIYDRYSLGELLRRVGFREVKVCPAFESSIANFEKYELDVVNGAVRKPDSVFMEGIKR